MKPRHGTFTSFDATSIAYRIWGKPTSMTPVVCCSGIACDDTHWTHLAPHLAQERQVITWDYPHHGQSSAAGDPAEITIPSLAQHAVALMDHLAIGGFGGVAAPLRTDPRAPEAANPPKSTRAVFMGHSMGVQVAFEAVRLAPERVSALVAIAGPYGKTVGSLYGTTAGGYLLSLLESAARASPDKFASFWRFITDARIADPVGRLGGLIGHAPAAEMSLYFDHLRKLDPARLLEMFRAGQEHSAEDLLDSIRIPVLIIHGTADVMTPVALAEEMERRIPGAQLIKVKGGAHTLPIEDPTMINAEVTRFLNDEVDVEPAKASAGD